MHRIILIGAGLRGMMYSRTALEAGRAQIVAVAEPHAGRRKAAQEAFGVPDHLAFERAEDLFERGSPGEAAIIASQDRDHYAQVMMALDAGCDLLLEKPISPFPWECMRILRKATDTGRRVLVCHVLRYSPFFREVHRLVSSGTYGQPVDIQHNENIGNFHMAHSFVRGNWSNSERSSPIIIQKSCHDMDLLAWYAGSRARRLASFGGLSFFREENAPAGSAARCLDCGVAAGCRYDVRKVYLPAMGEWPATALTMDQTEEGLMEAFRTGPYGRCVYRCDNDVCDHQVASIEFENGATASFNLSAFTSRISRTMKIMCEHAEINASEFDNVISVAPFPSTQSGKQLREVIHPRVSAGEHSGGDLGLVQAFLDMLDSDSYEPPTSIALSVESHFMAGAAELSRTESRVVEMNAYRNSLMADAGI